MISSKEARKWFDYSPETGKFTRLTRRGKSKAGSELTGTKSHGYLRAILNGKSCALHRLAFLWMTGAWPAGDVDHIDGNRENNRWSNLRDVDRSTNLENIKSAKSNNKGTGLLGAYPHKSGRFYSRIQVRGSDGYLGMFDTAQEAHSAYVKAKRDMHKGNML